MRTWLCKSASVMSAGPKGRIKTKCLECGVEKEIFIETSPIEGSYEMPYKFRDYLPIGAALIICLAPSLVYAASNNKIGGFTGLPIAIVLALVYLTRRRAIGGWLLYYYLQLFFTFTITLALIPSYLNELNSEGMENTELYALFVIPTVSIIFIKILEVFFAARLLVKSKRNLKNVRVLLYVLLASLIANAITLAIDDRYFQDNIGMSMLGFSFAFIWTVYFFFSSRVNYVLCNWPGTWDYQSFKSKSNKIYRNI